MGLSMCGHIMEKGYPATIFNRSKEKSITIIDKGADWVDTPSEVTKKSDIVFTMLGFPEDVRQVYFGKDVFLEDMQAGPGDGRHDDVESSQPNCHSGEALPGMTGCEPGPHESRCNSS